MKRRYDLDKPGMLRFAAGFIGMRTLDCIEAYAHKRKIVLHRAGQAFWDLVDEGLIVTAIQKDVEKYEVLVSVAEALGA
jgi:hypothetical protein